MIVDAQGVPRLIQRISPNSGRSFILSLFDGSTLNMTYELTEHVVHAPIPFVLALLYSADPTPLYDDLDAYVLKHMWHQTAQNRKWRLT